MIKKVFQHIWTVLSALAIIGGALAFIQHMLAGDEYNIKISIKSQEKIIENKTGMSDLVVNFKGRRVEKLFATKISLKNTGKRAITKDFVYQPITIEVLKPANILQISSDYTEIFNVENIVTAGFDLINPNESIDFLINSDQLIKIRIGGKIREIQKIEFSDEVSNPSAQVRLYSGGIGWLIGALVFLMLLTDAFFVVRSDAKLSAVFSLVKSLPESGNVDKAEFLKELKRLYEIYYKSGPILFVKPDELIEIVSKKISSSSPIIEGRDIERIRKEVINYASFANLYTIRSTAILWGPVAFGFCFINLLFVFFR